MKDLITESFRSLGRCVAEMKICGVETEYTKRPYDFSVAFVLRSLLIADFLQSFGPEYKLLVSSQRDASCKSHEGNTYSITHLCGCPLSGDDFLLMLL